MSFGRETLSIFQILVPGKIVQFNFEESSKSPLIFEPAFSNSDIYLVRFKFTYSSLAYIR